MSIICDESRLARAQTYTSQITPEDTYGYIYSKNLLDSIHYSLDTVESDFSSYPSLPKHIDLLISSVMRSVYEGETTGICPDDFRRDQFGRYRYKAVIGCLRACYFSDGVFFAILQERLFQLIISKNNRYEQKLKIIFTAGSSGSGKSTIVSKLSRDTRGILFFDAIQSSQKYRRLCLKRIKRYIKGLLEPIENIEDYVQFICINVNTPLDICIQRNKTRLNLADTEVSTRLRYERLKRFPPSIEDGFNNVVNITTEDDYRDFLQNYLSDDIPIIEAGDRRPHRE